MRREISRSRLFAAACIVSAACIAWGRQSAAQSCADWAPANSESKLPQFEVATIKPGKVQPPFIVGLSSYPGGRVEVTNLNLKNLVMIVCDFARFQVSGGPAWMDTDRFVIEAKPPESSPSATSQPADPNASLSAAQRQMLLALLINRFQLKFHVETKEGPVYYLERSDKVNLQLPKDPTTYPWAGVEQGMAGIRGVNVSMPEFAKRLSAFFQRPVIDKTGIAGSFDFDSKVGESDDAVSATQEDTAARLITAIRGLGLKVTAAKGPVESLVIDHAEQPSPN